MKIKLMLVFALAGSTLAARAQTNAPAAPASSDTTAMAKEQTLTTRAAPVGVGDVAPDFTLSDTEGRAVKLSDVRGKSPVVLVFYRGYWCPFCARQLADLRSLVQRGEKVRLYAVSVDPPATSKEFAGKIASDGKGAISFPILSDPDHHTIDAYGLLDPAYTGKRFEGVPHPSVYVIDRKGRVTWAKIESDYKLRPSNQDIRAALDAVKN